MTTRNIVYFLLLIAGLVTSLTSYLHWRTTAKDYELELDIKRKTLEKLNIELNKLKQA